MYLINYGLLKSLKFTIDHLKTEKLSKIFHLEAIRWYNNIINNVLPQI
jgi:hypothetical protein